MVTASLTPSALLRPEGSIRLASSLSRVRRCRQPRLARYHRSFTTGPTHAPSANPQSRLRRSLGLTLVGLGCAGLGFFVGTAPALSGILSALQPRSDEETVRAYAPTNQEAASVEAKINNHPLVAELRKRSDLTESRPHMKFPEAFRQRNLTAGILLGPGRLTVPPFSWTENGGKSLVTILHLGTDLCGHPGIVHGGLLATLLDEGLARCCFDALPNKIAVTAKLEVNYRKPTPAGSFVVLRAETKQVEGRKAWVEGRIETLVDEGEQPTILAEASGLFVSPKSRLAMLLSRLYMS
ncbi:thioesterase family protein [Sodiomyces alkalinus F11]|uniref:Thioesterase family protein n=1 Tax=Sodiomyces alkalinus (strain CBS 110278 / VKM F-3762 / F11) TaxID=1314773 RepID=A0A3N2Q021_SODAK|nr:thioesterase family protein [Sodiomyces alkalinus F11]ROT40119.1 thioesterase family protein [Sodiomyces alkalinus F11]